MLRMLRVSSDCEGLKGATDPEFGCVLSVTLTSEREPRVTRSLRPKVCCVFPAMVFVTVRPVGGE